MGVRVLTPLCLKRPDRALSIRTVDGLFAVISTRRPGKDSSSAEAEFRRRTKASGHGRLLRPPELGAVRPDATQDDGKLARDRNPGLLRPDPLGEPHTPGLQRRPALHLCEKHV